MPGEAERRPQAQGRRSTKRSAATEVDSTGADDVAAGLEIARELAQNGFPVFLAKPAMVAVQERKADGSPGKVRMEWDPSGGHQDTGYWFPKAWQQTEPDPSVVDRWEPGMALGLVTGRGIDVLDIDPRNDGDIAALDGQLPTVYGEASTPSGGSHHLIASLGERKKVDYLPGVDIQAGDPDGKGRGFVFLEPTVKLSKVTGKPAVYRWTTAPEVDPFLLELDRTGEPLAEGLRAVARKPERFEVGPEDPATPEDRENAARVLGSCVDSVSSTDEGARNDRLFGQTRMLYGFALGGSLDFDDVTDRMTVAGEACGLDGDEIAAVLESASNHADFDGPTRPERLEDVFEPIEEPGKVSDPGKWPTCQWNECAERVTSWDFLPSGKFCKEHEIADRKRRDAIREASGANGPPRPEGISDDAWKVMRRRLAIREADDYERSLKDRPEWVLVENDDDLLEPLDPDPELIEGLVPKDGNALLTAPFKAGKTTTMMNLVKDLLEGTPFLGHFGIAPYDGNVSMWNYEVSASMFRRWRLEAGVKSTAEHRLFVANLRGRRVDLLDDRIAEDVVKRLKQTETGVWIVDPLARAAAGLDENSNTDMGQFFERVDEIKEEAGVHTLVLVHHTGREGDRSRGASRIDDWPDALLSLTKDKDGTRFLGAVGRDVDQAPGSLEFDPETRRLSWVGGSKRNSGQFQANDNWEPEVDDAILFVCRDEVLTSGRKIYEAVKQIEGFKCRRDRVFDRVKALIEDGRIEVDGDTKRHRVV